MPKIKDKKRNLEMTGEIEKAIRIAEIPQKELAALLGIGYSTFRERMRDPGKFRVKELREIARLTGCDLAELVK